MKSTGIVRKLDELGRIVLPIELRRTLEMAERERLEIYVDGDKIILKKYIPEKQTKRAKKYICSICQREIDASEIESRTELTPRKTRSRGESSDNSD